MSAKIAGTATVTRCITYEQLREDPDFPKGRLGYIGWIFKKSAFCVRMRIVLLVL